MALFQRWRASNKEFVHEAFERGEASFADEEEDQIVPTIIAEASMVMDDEEAIESDVKLVEGTNPSAPQLADLRAQVARAQADVEAAKAALVKAQDAKDKADDAYKSMDSQFHRDGLHESVAFVTNSSPKYGDPGGAVDSERSTILDDRAQIENDLAIASRALADADAAKAQADADLRQAQGKQ